MDLSPAATIASSVTLFTSVISIFPTLSAITAYFRSESIRNSHQNLLLLNLLVNSLLLATKSIVTNGVMVSTRSHNVLVGLGCSIDGFVNLLCGGIEINTLLFIAIERYFAIVKQKQLSLKQIVSMLIVGWVMVGFIASMPLWLSSYNYVPSATKVYCLLPFRDRNEILLNIICLVPVPISIAGICYCYAKVYSFYRTAGIRKRMTQEKSSILRSGGLQQESHKVEEDKERKVFYTTVLLVGWTLLGWLSMFFIMSYQVITGMAPNTEWDYISFILTGVAISGDSIILLVSDKRWKDSLKGIIRRRK